MTEKRIDKTYPLKDLEAEDDFEIDDKIKADFKKLCQSEQPEERIDKTYPLKDYVNVVDINVPKKTQVIRVILPKDKDIFQTQERLDEVWIFLKDK